MLTDSKWLEFILNQIFNASNINAKIMELSKVTVTSSGSKSNSQTILSIRDNGIGIRKKIFQEYSKNPLPVIMAESNPKSTGMGLYIAKKIV